MLYQVCTHHRCGTVLFRNAFRTFADKNGLVFYKGKAKDAPADTVIHQSAHSTQEEVATSFDIKGIHLYRNPVEMLSSHIKYHEKSDSPLEASNKLLIGGVLYKDYIKSLDDIDQKAVFEINNIFGRTLRAMLAWDYSDNRYLNLNLSEFKAEKLNSTCDRIAQHFDFDEQQAISLLKCLEAANNNKAVKAKHVTSSGKEPKIKFSKDTIKTLDASFPDLKAFMDERF
jgi:hypothetical protein